MADITSTLLTSGNDSTAAASYTTASVTPSSNELILISIILFRQGAVDTPAVTGNGITYTLISQLDFVDPGSNNTSIFMYRGLAASPSAGIITIGLGADHQSICWIVAEHDNVDTGGSNGADAVVQFSAVDGGSVANNVEVAASLAAFGNANNATVIAAALDFGNDVTSDALDPSAGLTEIAEENENTDSSHLAFAHRVDNDTTPGYDHNNVAASKDLAVIGVEIKNADQGVVGVDEMMAARQRGAMQPELVPTSVVAV